MRLPGFGYRQRGWVGLLALVAIAVAAAMSAGNEEEADEPGGEARHPVSGRVISVTDGDTVEAWVDGSAENVRYIGIDTPEVDPSIGVECFGEEASALNRELVGDRRVRLVFDDELRDRYDRLLAYVYVGRLLVNAEIVRRGYARTLTIPPNTDRASLFARLEREAGRQGRGLWARCPA
jgi:micrococcal nuclease